jgi:hypothetical protein
MESFRLNMLKVFYFFQTIIKISGAITNMTKTKETTYSAEKI